MKTSESVMPPMTNSAGAGANGSAMRRDQQREIDDRRQPLVADAVLEIGFVVFAHPEGRDENPGLP